jgi:membrane protease subunit (stomatin/prohibitin family)
MIFNPFTPPDPPGPRGDIAGAEARQTFYWEDPFKGENVLFRLPRNIRLNDNIVVREDEYALFFRDGKVLQLFDRPDRYALTTENLPVLGVITKALTGIVQLGEIYWVQRREFRANFGTAEPLIFRDPDFGLVRLRIFGQFAYKVIDPVLFITQFVGTRGMTQSDEVVRWIKEQIVVVLNELLGELKDQKKMSILDIPAHLLEIEQLGLSRMNHEVGGYGLAIMKLLGLNINLPDEVQAAVDKRGAMATLGVDYIQYETGKAIEGAGVGASKGGDGSSLAGLGAGAGAGFAIGQAMASGMKSATEGSPGAMVLRCRKCNAILKEGSQFCSACGIQILLSCPRCQAPVNSSDKFCAKCGTGLVAGDKKG